MNALLHNRALTFLHNLDRLSVQGQQDAFVNEVLESNGCFTAPKHDRSHLWELCLHGINATGATEEEAIANWKRLAHKPRAQPPVEDDGFVTVHPPQPQCAGGMT